MSWYDQNSNTSSEAKTWVQNAGFLVVKPSQLQRSGFSCGKTRCNGSVPVPTLTRNRSSGLEPLLTLDVSETEPWPLGKAQNLHTPSHTVHRDCHRRLSKDVRRIWSRARDHRDTHQSDVAGETPDQLREEEERRECCIIISFHRKETQGGTGPG